MSDNLFRQHIRAILQFEEEHEQRHEAVLADYEAKGHRIVSGGQTDHHSWEVTDYRTGELIIKGDNGLDGYDQAIEEHGQMWAHIDPITEHLFDIPDPVTPGLPESLCETLAQWVREGASGNDIAVALGEAEPEAADAAHSASVFDA